MLETTKVTNPEDVIGSVHSWELVTAVDGPGTRLTIFLSGCPLRCLYCHNPDTRFEKWGQKMSAHQIMKMMDRYAPALKASGGGVTISGGEAMMQPQFVSALVGYAKSLGLHVALDTTGYLGSSMSDDLIDQIDLFLLDIKSGNEAAHRRVTKRPLRPVLDFAQRLSDMNKTTWIRSVLVSGLTDDSQNVDQVAQHVSAMGSCVERVEILPFHQMGRDKWESVGLKYELNEVEPPSKGIINRVCQQFSDYGLPVLVG